MLLAAGVAFACLVLTTTADTGCTSRGGVCQTHSIACRGSYISGLCNGAFNRRCCLPRAGASRDTGCTSRGGVCQTDSLACAGSYASGLCGGAANRRCCLPPAGTSRDTGCTSRGGVCQTDSLACAGSYASGLCDGAANRRCCLPPAGTSSGACPLVTYSFAGTRFANGGAGSSARVHPDFLPKMHDMNTYADSCNVTILVTSHFRKVPIVGNQWNAERSCHMIGHAIDMNLRTDAGKSCNSVCLKGYASLTQNDGIACFLKNIKSHPSLHWGIDFNDPVHIDDRVCTNNAAFDSKILTLVNC